MKKIEVSDEVYDLIKLLELRFGKNWFKAFRYAPWQMWPLEPELWPTPGKTEIRSSPELMGGDACVRDTRIPVWLLVSYRQQGLSDRDLIMNFPQLQVSDLAAAWEYYAANSKAVDKEIEEHQAENGEAAG